jgi:uncharacterized protein (DUF58 family)
MEDPNKGDGRSQSGSQSGPQGDSQAGDTRVAEPIEQEVAAVAGAYHLALAGNRYRGRIGRRRGVGPGSSLEFHDYRDYAPGDDLRHVDWRGYARSDQLRVRLHEAEVAPIVEVLVDTSPSMASTEAKLRTLRGLVLALQTWTRGEGSSGRTLVLGGSVVHAESFADEAFACTGSATPEMPRVPLRAGSVRILVTDALWSTDPNSLLNRISAGASRFACLQLLDPWERQPTSRGAKTLVDCESGARQSLRLDDKSVQIYCERLARLCATLHESVVRLGGECVPVTADSLAMVCQRDLVPMRILEPA